MEEEDWPADDEKEEELRMGQGLRSLETDSLRTQMSSHNSLDGGKNRIGNRGGGRSYFVDLG